MRDLHELPKFRDGWSYLYVEHCKVDQDAKAIAIHDADGKVPVPCASLALLMLGPGTSITHAAIKVLADCGCLVAWCGEQGLRFYAQGLGENRSSEKLLHQARLCIHPELRLRVVLNMYRVRFDDQLDESLSLQQIRGKEGIRVRDTYARMSRETGVEWKGRCYDRGDWQTADPVNRALSAANACLYGICHAAIISAGYSPGLGFVHTGKQLSFVYDIADLYKTETTIPVAFRIASTNPSNADKEARYACRQIFEETRLLARIVDDIGRVLDVGPIGLSNGSGDDYSADATLPGAIWDPDAGEIAGGVNYSDAEEVAAGSGGDDT